MKRRLRAALAGGAVAAVLLGAALALSPWRPTGPLIAVALLGLVAPSTAAVGVAMTLRASGTGEDLAAAMRLTAYSTPVTVLLTLFTIHVIAVEREPGLQQLAALVLGVASAGYIGARFTGPAADEAE